VLITSVKRPIFHYNKSTAFGCYDSMSSVFVVSVLELFLVFIYI